MPKKKKKKKAKKKARINKNKKRAKKIVKKRKRKSTLRFKSKTINIKFNKKKNLFLIKFIQFQENLIQKFKFKINFNLDKKIQNFFDSIDEKIQAYKVIRTEEKAKIKLRELERIEKEKEDNERKRKENLEIELKIKEKTLKEEQRLEKERTKDIKLFLRKEQALIRKEQAERQKKFLKEVIIPVHKDTIFKCYKISKRFDDDISAVFMAINLKQKNQIINKISITLGGMAEIPKKAINTEKFLNRKKFNYKNFIMSQ